MRRITISKALIRFLHAIDTLFKRFLVQEHGGDGGGEEDEHGGEDFLVRGHGREEEEHGGVWEAERGGREEGERRGGGGA